VTYDVAIYLCGACHNTIVLNGDAMEVPFPPALGHCGRLYRWEGCLGEPSLVPEPLQSVLQAAYAVGGQAAVEGVLVARKDEW
jgi:hypothetical protein